MACGSRRIKLGWSMIDDAQNLRAATSTVWLEYLWAMSVNERELFAS